MSSGRFKEKCKHEEEEEEEERLSLFTVLKCCVTPGPGQAMSGQIFSYTTAGWRDWRAGTVPAIVAVDWRLLRLKWIIEVNEGVRDHHQEISQPSRGHRNSIPTLLSL